VALERDLVGIVRFLICVKWYQRFGYFLAMARDCDGLQDLSTRMDNVEEEIRVVKSTLDSVIQELKRLFLKIDD